MYYDYYPRIVISGLAGDSGKTIVSCGLLASLRNSGLNIYAFKKGPDYIDAAWLSLASGKPARNLDSFMMGFPAIKKSFIKNACKTGINIIEGNRGLFDGLDSKGTHSTAELAKHLQSPVLIVQNVSKVTRTASASIHGCLKLDPNLNIEGVILNRVAGERHGNIVKEAIEGETGVPVLGMIPKLSERCMLPSRHLGLVMPGELEEKSILISELKNVIENSVDIPAILKISNNVLPIEDNQTSVIENNFHNSENSQSTTLPEKVVIGYFKDRSFSFYYPENLEMLEKAGAELLPLSPSQITTESLTNEKFNNIDALYIGGGFPEVNLAELASNTLFSSVIKSLAEEGLPIYAECGGLIYLADKILWKDKEYQLSGILPLNIQMHDKPQGHGYIEAVTDINNPFFNEGTVIKGHEFHYSEIYECDPNLKSALSVIRGAGSINKRDGLIYKNVFASYIHVHALATPEWVSGMIKCARKYKELKKTQILIEG
jgi:cobyrinic acid a,c-diamide synthase